MAKQKSAAEIMLQIAKLKEELKAKERAERERIGKEMQARTGRKTWEEIVIILDGKCAKKDSV